MCYHSIIMSRFNENEKYKFTFLVIFSGMNYDKIRTNNKMS